MRSLRVAREWRGFGRSWMAAVLFLGLGIALAVGAHLGVREAERRARRAYEELVGEEAATNPPEDLWEEVRPLVGSWGCLLMALEFVRGVSLVVAGAAAVYLVAGR